MNKDELINIIAKHMANKDVGVGLLYCLSEPEQINSLADELVKKLNIDDVSKRLERPKTTQVLTPKGFKNIKKKE